MNFQVTKEQRIFCLLPNYSAWQDTGEINEHRIVNTTFDIKYFSIMLNVKERSNGKFVFLTGPTSTFLYYVISLIFLVAFYSIYLYPIKADINYNISHPTTSLNKCNPLIKKIEKQ